MNIYNNYHPPQIKVPTPVQHFCVLQPVNWNMEISTL
jgi:hypothetical protein